MRHAGEVLLLTRTHFKVPLHLLCSDDMLVYPHNIPLVHTRYTLGHGAYWHINVYDEFRMLFLSSICIESYPFPRYLHHAIPARQFVIS
jgi:hypothetical protein